MPSAVWHGVVYWLIGIEFVSCHGLDGSWSQCHDNDVNGGARFDGWHLSPLQLSPSLR